MSPASMLKGVDSRIDDASLDRRGLGELDSSQEGHEDSDERGHSNLKRTSARRVAAPYVRRSWDPKEWTEGHLG